MSRVQSRLVEVCVRGVLVGIIERFRVSGGKVLGRGKGWVPYILSTDRWAVENFGSKANFKDRFQSHNSSASSHATGGTGQPGAVANFLKM